MISNHAEGTFARLRYLLGGDRPSQTARLTLSSNWIHNYKLENSYNKGSIPLFDSIVPSETTSKSPTYALQIG